MPKVALTSKAASDLDGIYEHHEALRGPEKAEETIFQILDSLSQLEAFPQLGKASGIPDCRELIFARYPYRAIYTLKGIVILVYRILHQHAERPEEW